MEQIFINTAIFAFGIIFGAGSFYGLVLTKFNTQNQFNCRVESQLKELADKIDDIKTDIVKLTERISRIEGKINGKLA